MPLDTPGSRDIRSSVCPHDCPSACALEVEVLDGARIGAVRGADNSYTSGVVCAKVARYAERAHHPERLTHPLLRTGPKGSGQFSRISWDEALDRVAEGFRRAAAEHGKLAVWPYHSAGTMGLVQRDGIERLRNVMGYSRQKMTICTAIAAAGWQAGVGDIWGPDTREIGGADLVVVWGGNPVSTQVNLMSHITRARKERGARLVVIDPYRTPSAAAADMHLALRPGTDAALACAAMHVAFRDGYADRGFMERYADRPAELEAHLAPRGPEWAAGITGLGVGEIEAFARWYGGTERAFIRVGYGFTRSRNGAANMHAVTCLPTVCGKWRHEGGGATWSQRGIYGWDKTLIEGLEHRDTSIRELDMSRIASVLTSDPAALCGGPPVHAILIQSSNPASIAPDSHRVREGMLREDLFVAVHDQFMTDTAQLADVVLPATMFFEHDDIYQAGGHSHIQFGPKLIEPPGEARSNHAVVCALAGRLGAEHRGFGMTALEMADATLRASGWPDVAALRERRWVDAQPDFARSHHLTGFGHPDGKFRFAADWAALGPHSAGLPRLPDHAALTDDAGPFRLVAPPPRQFLNSTFTETAGSRKREGRPTVRLCPADAALLGIAEGSRVRLGNARGVVELHAAIGEGQQSGVVIAEGVWPNAAWNGGIGINALTSDAPAGPAGGAVFHDTSVWVEAA